MRRAPPLLRWGLASALATLLLALCLRGARWDAALAAAAGASPGWIFAAVLANAALVPVWAAQWRLFLPRPVEVPFPRLVRISAVMAMTANSVPYMAGHATGFHLLATRGGIGHAAALSVLTLDQLSEGAAKVALLVALALVAPLPEPLRAGLLVLAPGVVLLLALTLLCALRPSLLLRLALAVGGDAAAPRGRLSRGWLAERRARLGAFARGWSEGLGRARRPGVLATGAAFSLGMRLLEGCGMVLVQTALGAEVPLAGTLLVLAAVSLATMVSLAPANLGVYEGAAFLAYRSVGVDAETALALAVLQHLAYLVALGGAGWAAVALRRVGAPGSAQALEGVGARVGSTRADAPGD